MERYRYIAKRLLTAIPTFLGITILVYVVASLAPSSPLEILFNDPYATAEEMARKSKELGLDQPVIIQYIRWLVQLVQGNMGMSIRTNGQVLDMILERIGPTLILTGSAMALTIIIALPLGIMSLISYSGWDYISSGLSFIGSAMPNFFAGLVLIYFFCIKVKLFPTSGMYDSSGVRTWPMFFHHLVLPAVVLAIQQIGSLIRQCRGSMLEVLQDDYVRTASAKGLHEPSVLVRHALRNAWIPLVSWFGMQIPFLIGGAVVTEQIFGWPGLGSLMVQSINARDYPVIMGITVVIAIVVLLGNLLVDWCTDCWIQGYVMTKKKEGENMKQDERLKDIPANSYFHDVLQRFCAHKPAMVSAFVLTLEIILVIALPYILHLDPYTSDYEVMFGSAPSALHWLGTDDIGRDIFARFIYGGRVSLSVGIISAVISMAVGVPLGLLAGTTGELPRH